MPSPTTVPYRSPETAYERPVLAFTAACPSCSEPCPWTATVAGEMPHCNCTEQDAA